MSGPSGPQIHRPANVPMKLPLRVVEGDEYPGEFYILDANGYLVEDIAFIQSELDFAE